MNEPATITFPSLAAKAAWMDGAASLDALDPYVRILARILTAHEDTPRDRAERLHAWVRDRLWYSHDPYGIECTPDTRVACEAGTEDCDGKARVLVALVRSLDGAAGAARIRALFSRSGLFYHVQAELRPHERAPWILAETIVRGVDVGGDPEEARNATGDFPVI